eukprot:g3999.t1
MALDADSVIDAQEDGVQQWKLQNWLSSYPGTTTFFVGEVNVDEEVRQGATDFAVSKLGRPYAFNFEPPEMEDKYYCSSLVDYSYRHALGSKRPVFTKIPMPLIWEPVDFWKKYYAQMKKTLPHYNGSNPTMLLQSDRVQYAQLKPAVMI